MASAGSQTISLNFFSNTTLMWPTLPARPAFARVTLDNEEVIEAKIEWNASVT